MKGMKKEIKLIGNSGIQFYDGVLNLEHPAVINVGIDFAEIVSSGDGGKQVSLVLPEYDDSLRKFINPDTREEIREDKIYSIKARQAIQYFEGLWAPLPYFRKETYQENFHQGPTTWARMWFNAISDVKESSDPNTHNVVLAFDTTCGGEETESYLAPQPEDLNGSQFAAAIKPEHNGFFVGSEWVEDWLKQIFESRKKELGLENNQYNFIHIGLYLTLLKVLDAAGAFPTVSLHSANKAIEVDLVLDVGNSRTIGLVVETTNKNHPFSFTNCEILEIRDLSIPDRKYNRPFEMHCEFLKTDFGPEASSKLSGKKNSFNWPSLVRVGPEAVRLAVLNGNINYHTGMSSPKRYLWDTQKREEGQEWYFNSSAPESSRAKLALNDFSALFTEEGELVKEGKISALNPVFPRSAVMVFALGEIFLHAISFINSPQFRKKFGQETIPRKLKRVVLTCPPAMLETEKFKLRNSAGEAIQALKIYFGDCIIAKDMTVIPAPEDAFLSNGRGDWGYDEATCSQLAYIYSEITHRYSGDSKMYFQWEGKIRQDAIFPGKPAVTIASIDIGGGTTDLMICSYQESSDPATVVLNPEPKFWESFNLAGDDIIKGLIEQVLLPVIRDKAEECGCRNPIDAMNFLFGPDVGNQSIQHRVLRKMFANQVALPFALGMMQHATEERQKEVRNFDSFFIDYPAPHPQVLEHINRVFNKHGARDFKIQGLQLTLENQAIDLVIRNIMQKMIGILCGVISQFNCDYLILAGRPTVLPVIKEIFLQYLPLSPDRIIPLGRYRIGIWYPFAQSNGIITDPKTCVVVGATVGLMAGSLNRLEGFRMDTRYLKEKVKSTANYIGSFNKNKCILSQVFFKEDSEYECEFDFNGPMLIGMRQMNSDR
ncbi:MAG: hypothetical protein QG657_4927, partial [Acidobacteriota bacterium]|nr:hypothetical protein [Acidobacteriota bacterium]